MANDDTLFSRKSEQEVDEALEWLETIGNDGAAPVPAANASRRNAYEVLPTWLKMDLHLDAKSEPPINAPRIQNDNLSWLDSIASGLGGPIEEPPTMSWDETAIVQISEQERAQALSDAVNKAQSKFEGDEIDVSVVDAADAAALELDKPYVPAETSQIEETRHGIPPVEPVASEEFPLTDEELSAIYAQVERDFSAEIPEEPLFPTPPIEQLDEPEPDLTPLVSIPAPIEAEDAIEFDDEALASLVDETFYKHADDGDDLTPPMSYLDMTPFDGSLPLSPETFPILSDEINSVREQFLDDPLDVMPVVDTSDLSPLPQDYSYEPTQIYLPDDLGQDVESGFDEVTQIFRPNSDAPVAEPDSAEVVPQEPTQIYLPDPTQEPKVEESELIDSVSELTEIYLPNVESEPPAPTLDVPVVDELPEQTSDFDVAQLDKTQIYLPPVELPVAPDNADPFEPPNAAQLTEIYLPDSLPPIQTPDEVTHIAESLEEAQAFAGPIYDREATGSVEEITEIFLPDPESLQRATDSIIDFDAAVPMAARHIESEALPKIVQEESVKADAMITEIFIPEYKDGSHTPEPVALEPDSPSIDEPAIAAIAEPTIISMVPISDRWKALAKVNPVVPADDPMEVELPDLAVDTEGDLKVASSIADAIPEDPDEAMAWLEMMARGEPAASPRSGLRQQDITETIAATPEQVTRGLQEMREQRKMKEQAVEQEVEAVDNALDFAEAAYDEAGTEVTQVSRAIPAEAVEDAALLEQLRDDEITHVPKVEGLDKSGLVKSPLRSAEPKPIVDLAPFESNEAGDELNDALAWLEDVASRGDTNVNEMTVELDQDDVARLLEEHLTSRDETRTDYIPPSSAVQINDLDDQPTMITEMPDINEALGVSEVASADRYDDSNELDEALAWLEAFSDENLSEAKPGDLAANAYRHSVIDETVAPIYEPERMAAHSAIESQDFSAIYRTYSGILIKQDELGAGLVATDVSGWIAKYPEQPQLHQLLAEANLQLGKFELAAQSFKRAISLL